MANLNQFVLYAVKAGHSETSVTAETSNYATMTGEIKNGEMSLRIGNDVFEFVQDGGGVLSNIKQINYRGGDCIKGLTRKPSNLDSFSRKYYALAADLEEMTVDNIQVGDYKVNAELFDGITQDISNLDLNVGTNTTSIGKIKDTITVLEQSINKNSSSISDMDATIRTMEEKISTLQTETSTKLESLKTNVAKNSENIETNFEALNIMDTETIPAMQGNIQTNIAALNVLNTETIPAIQENVQLSIDTINTINSTLEALCTNTLPTLITRIETLEEKVKELSPE